MQASKVVSEIQSLIERHGDQEMIGYCNGTDYDIDSIEYNDDDGRVILMDMSRIAK